MNSSRLSPPRRAGIGYAPKRPPIADAPASFTSPHTLFKANPLRTSTLPAPVHEADEPKLMRPGIFHEIAAPRPRGLRGTKAFLDPLYVQPGSVHSGRASEMTDGYALGFTMLLTVTGLGPTGLVHRCRDMLMNPDEREKWQLPAVPNADSGAWPPKVATGLVRLIVGLTWEPLASRRLPLPAALKDLEALAATVGVDDITTADF